MSIYNQECLRCMAAVSESFAASASSTIKCENKVTVFAEFIAVMHDACCDDVIPAIYRTDGASWKWVKNQLINAALTIAGNAVIRAQWAFGEYYLQY